MAHAAARIERLMMAVTLGLALTFAPAFISGSPAEAQGSSSGSGGGVKTCKAKLANGKQKTWRCQKNEVCCINKTTGTTSCGSPLMGCL